MSAALTVWHLAGVLGFLGPVSAWVIACVGLVGVGKLVWRNRGEVGRRLGGQIDVAAPPVWVWVCVPGLAVLVAACASPPGALWGSEYGGYDALSYHLALPQAWLAEGRVWPSETNVYSFLPGYLEVAFAQVGALTFAPVDEGGLLAGGGWRVTAVHLLHGSMVVLGAWLGVRALRALRGFAGSDAIGVSGERVGAMVAGGLVAMTPWCVVVGSLAYNEMAVVVLGLAGVIAASDEGVAAVRRGVVCAVVVGAACGVKPTALFLVGPVVGAVLVSGVLVSGVPARRLGMVLGVGAVVGLVMLAPWLGRNWAVCGNPVFPFAQGVFGSGHWSGAQAAAWEAGHTVDGSIADRLRLGFWTAAGTDPETAAVERWRGVFNPQWGVLFLVTVASLAGVVFVKRTRRIGLALAGGLGVSLACWVVLTHVQSRFLIPLMVGASPAVGLAAGLLARVPVRGLAWLVGGVVVGAQGAALMGTWASQNGGMPNALLLAGTDGIRGVDVDVVEEASAVRFVNGLDRTGALVLVGEARSFYYRADADRPVIAATTWDRTFLDEAMLAEPDEPAAWVAALREVGATHVLIGFAELGRLERSGYRPAALGPDAAARLAEVLVPLRAWRETGVVVFEVPGAGSTIGVE